MQRATSTEVTFRIFLMIFIVVPIVGLSTRIVQADTQVGGPITSDTTWSAANSPYIVVESVEVWEGVTLTIEPGVVVKFDPEKKLQVSGELIAQGTDGNPVTFTSNQPDPAPGDWGNIEFSTTAVTTTMDSEGNYIGGSLLQYCVVECAGADVDSAIETHSLLVDGCKVRNNDARGIYITDSAAAPSRIVDSFITNNGTDQWNEWGVAST